MATAAPTTIKIAGDLHHTRTESSFRPTGRTDTRLAGGVFNARSHSRSSIDRRLSVSRATHEPRADARSIGEAEEGDEWQNEDAKKKQVFRGTTLLWYDSLGPSWCFVRIL